LPGLKSPACECRSSSSACKLESVTSPASGFGKRTLNVPGTAVGRPSPGWIVGRYENSLQRVIATVLLIPLLAGAASGTKTLDIVFIDVEGGASTLVVTPARQSLLIDAGYGGREGRDPARIRSAIADAGIERIDYLLVTHFHNDHVGGVPELASSIPIGTFIDYGSPLGTDRMANGAFRNYEPVRGENPHLQPKPGDRLPLDGIEATVVSTGGSLLSEPLAGGGGSNPACARAEDYAEDGTENFRSIGVMLQFGAFRLLALGDLSGNTLTRLVCPRNLLGEASAYLIAHHGDYDTNVPALYAALRPQVAIMNNGVTKGGSPDAFKTLHAHPGLELWQLHESRNPRAVNSPDSRIANVDDGTTGYPIRLTALADGSFRIANGRTGFARNYPSRSSAQLPR
jgi:beta-lactamase superfamily II metal-dependent hydrolase